MNVLQEIGAFRRFVGGAVASRNGQVSTALDNRAIAAASGVDPLVFSGGILSTADDYARFQQAWQKAGVPTYMVNTRGGTESIRFNAGEVLRTIETALEETGANRVWLGAQSKGSVDVRWALQNNPEVLDVVNGAFLIVGPYRGGITTSPKLGAVVSAARSVMPQSLQHRLRASLELAPGSPELRELETGLPAFLDHAPEHFHMDNFHTSVTYRPLPAHDGIVPTGSQILGLEHPRLTEHPLTRGPFNHATSHMNPQVTRTMAEKIGAPGRVTNGG